MRNSSASGVPPFAIAVVGGRSSLGDAKEENRILDLVGPSLEQDRAPGKVGVGDLGLSVEKLPRQSTGRNEAHCAIQPYPRATVRLVG